MVKLDRVDGKNAGLVEIALIGPHVPSSSIDGKRCPFADAYAAADARACAQRAHRGRQPQHALVKLTPRMQLTLTVIHRATVAVSCRGLVEQ